MDPPRCVAPRFTGSTYPRLGRHHHPTHHPDTTGDHPMLLCGTPESKTTPTAPPILPSLRDLALLDALNAQRRRLYFLAEHLEHPAVSEGVTDAILEARDAMDHAVKLQAELCRLAGQL